jgi:shikimate kinase
VILKRTLSKENERPLLEVSKKAQRIQELLRFRKPFYERAADIKIDTSKLDISSAVEQITKKVKEDESFSS